MEEAHDLLRPLRLPLWVPRSTMTSSISALHRLADFSHALDLATVPGQVRRQGALSLLDTLGCMLAGSAAPSPAS